MMKDKVIIQRASLLIALAIVLLSWTKTTAQQDTIWASTGATWIYHTPTMTTIQLMEMKYLKDTIIQNQVVKQMAISRLTSVNPEEVDFFKTFVRNEYLFEDNDTIYWLREGEFEPLFHLSAQVGDSWEIKSNPNTSTASYPCDTLYQHDTVEVMNIEYRDYRGQMVEIIDFNSTLNQWSLSSFIKNIGTISSPFPELIVACDTMIDGDVGNEFGTLICYSDSIRGNIDFDNPFMDCLSLQTVNTEMVKEQKVKTITLYPNPAYEQVNFDLPDSKQWNLQVFDVTGKLVLQRQNITNRQLNISNLQQGMYYLRFQNSKGDMLNTKLLKL